MLVKYIGGRVRYDLAYNRKPYYFTPENNYILDIQEQPVIDYIFHLGNSSEFQAVVEPQEIIFNKESDTITIKTEEPKIIKKMGRPKKEKN